MLWSCVTIAGRRWRFDAEDRWSRDVFVRIGRPVRDVSSPRISWSISAMLLVVHGPDSAATTPSASSRTSTCGTVAASALVSRLPLFNMRHVLSAPSQPVTLAAYTGG